MATFSNNLGANSSTIMFICNVCDYKCSKKYNLDRHFLSVKHMKTTNSNNLATKNEQDEQNEQIYTCETCSKIYKDRTGLWRHKKKCETTKIKEETFNEPTDKEIIMMLINDNKDFKKLLLQVCKEKEEYKNMIMKVLENGTNNTTTNSHNKAFNLQFFLNETCKDAMNIMDFVDSIKLQLSDLERVGEFGFVEGISNIIVKNLKEMDVTQRPVHCTDKKRETLYIKDENKWGKDENKNTMHKVVKKVASKNQRLITKFKEVHPDCNKYSSRFSDQYNKIIVESFDSNYENEEKIIKKVSKEVLVEKEATTI